MNETSTKPLSELYDIVILGAGAAGLAAGLYSARGRMKTLMLERLAVVTPRPRVNLILCYGVLAPRGASREGRSRSRGLPTPPSQMGCSVLAVANTEQITFDDLLALRRGAPWEAAWRSTSSADRIG